MAKSTSDNDLSSDRARHLLRVLVETYIKEGSPVGSRTLSKGSGLELSPATIRNVMADLEEQGFIVAPHTSAGRVPTHKGYRLFVDTLIKLRPPSSGEINILQRELAEHSTEAKGLVAHASNMLSTLTHLAGVVTVPKQAHPSLSQIEFLPLSDRRVLAIMVVDNEEVQNRIIYLDRDYTLDELRHAANFLNQEFAGRPLSAVRTRLLTELQQTRQNMDKVMADAIEIASQALNQKEGERDEFVVTGQTNLMDFADLSNMETLRALFEGFNRQRDILHLLDKSLVAGGVQIFIGQESGYQMLDEWSLIAAPYTVDDDVVGVLGVIGPTRMAYERVIPIVDITARLLGSALNSRN